MQEPIDVHMMYVSVTYFYCAFSLYVADEQMRLAVNVRISEGPSESPYVIRAFQILRVS